MRKLPKSTAGRSIQVEERRVKILHRNFRKTFFLKNQKYPKTHLSVAASAELRSALGLFKVHLAEKVYFVHEIPSPGIRYACMNTTRFRGLVANSHLILALEIQKKNI